jgi:RNA polymerase sigma-70 factor (ECF subfamily)
VSRNLTPEQAFDQYHQAVFGFAYRLTGRADLAEDITQECFFEFVRAPRKFDQARGTVKTYLFAIARNLALKQYRDYRAEEPLPEDLPGAMDARDDLDVAGRRWCSSNTKAPRWRKSPGSPARMWVR